MQEKVVSYYRVKSNLLEVIKSLGWQLNNNEVNYLGCIFNSVPQELQNSEDEDVLSGYILETDGVPTYTNIRVNIPKQCLEKILMTPDKLPLRLGDIVKDRIARFSFYRQGYLYYDLRIAGNYYSFPIPIEDLGTATLPFEEKAIILMRYIRKALDNDMLTLVNKKGA